MADGMPILEVERAAEQDAIANSLLGLDAEGEPFADDHVEPMSQLEDRVFGDENEQGGEQQLAEHDDVEQMFDDAEARLEIERQEQEQAEAEQAEQQEQPAELTPAQVAEGLQHLDNTVQELGLNDPGEAAQLAHAVGIGANANLEQFGGTMAKAVLSTLSQYESGADPYTLRIPPAAAEAFAFDFLRSQGVDPRNVPVDANQLASAINQGIWNFLYAVDTMGPNVPLERLNSPEGAQWFADNLARAFGGDEGVARDYALKLADAGGKYILGILGRLQQRQADAHAARRQQAQPSRRSQGTRQPSGHRSPFRTNRDIFDDEVMERLDLEQGRYRK